MSESQPDRHLGSTRSERVVYSLRALGKKNLPEQIDLPGGSYQLLRTIKHDFWAVTGFYQDASGRRVVLKMGRTEEFAGLPLEWIGRWLCRREVRFYEKLADLPEVPRVLGRVGTTGFVHDYVPGQPLSKDRPVPDGFFAHLLRLMDELHRRNLAYVDTNKPQNILLGDDDRPHLIDFQISWDLAELGNWWLNRWWLHHLQQEDLYHCRKHRRRMRPDEMSEEELAAAQRKSPMIRLHRFLTKPYFLFRRRLFRRLRDTGRIAPEGSK